MLFVRCPFCHNHVLRWRYPAHESNHVRLRPDGQMEDHVSMPPKERYLGPLDGIPRHYFHADCGQTTGMPEEIVRSYLTNPFLYASRTFCCGCGGYVRHSELEWTETGERLNLYFERLRRTYMRRYGELPSVCAPEFRNRYGQP